MTTASELAQKHFAALMADIQSLQLDVDGVGRAMIDQIVQHAVERRGLEDVQAELRFLAENLDPDMDYIFMRP